MDRVRVEAVSKRYTLGEQRTLREVLSGVGRRGADRELWSLRDVSFTVDDGEAVGIVGRNGAGKSTLLKILMRITAPTSGRSLTRGRVAALLEVGTGFHPELTGRENVFLNAAVLGMSRAETLRRFDEIVDFAGTERFLDTPVKRYSSGMYLRLAFAVAAHLEPDVLIVDEVLAVGDAEFQRKCVQRLSSAGAEGRTVLFVSHDLATLTRLCTRVVWLEAGRVRRDGPTAPVVRDYLTSGSTGQHAVALDPGARAAGVTGVRVVSDRGDGPVPRDEPFTIEVDLAVRDELPGLDVAVFVTNERGVRVFDETLSDTQQVPRLTVGRYRVHVPVPPVLVAGDYTLGVWLGTAHEEVHVEPLAVQFTLHGEEDSTRERVVVLGLPFRVEPLVSPATSDASAQGSRRDGVGAAD